MHQTDPAHKRTRFSSPPGTVGSALTRPTHPTLIEILDSGGGAADTTTHIDTTTTAAGSDTDVGSDTEHRRELTTS